MSQRIELRLNALSLYPTLDLPRSMLRGIEKEALRVTMDGHLSMKPHPAALGSKLTHPFITTDYAESQLELITPPQDKISSLLSCLTNLHHFTQRHIDNEWLWPCSMPCLLGDESSIAIAQYGSSNSGQMKTIYRQGLSHRYGSHMQTISGLHYNLSFPEQFWEIYHHVRHSPLSLREFIDQESMGLIRNFIRLEPLIITLFGASPAVSDTYLPHKLLNLSQGNKSLFAEHATSLRMSDIGYQNSAQALLKVSYNTLQEFIHDLNYATSHTAPKYQQFGVKKQGQYQQLNDCILQIEAEYYGPIRPKRSTAKGERPTKALNEKGIEYIEIRNLDINPFVINGIDDNTPYFLEAFLFYCLLNDASPIDDKELQRLKHNHNQVVLNGLAPSCRYINANSDEMTMVEWAASFWPDLQNVADYLDSFLEEAPYRHAVDYFWQHLENPALLPSKKILAEMKTNFDNNFIEFALDQAERQHTSLLTMAHNDAFDKKLYAASNTSLESQTTLEKTTTISLDEYIQNYYTL